MLARMSIGDPPQANDAGRAARVHAYENPRIDVQSVVPTDAARIIDLGCSSGALGAALKRRQQVEVVGVEMDPDYAALADGRLDRVLQGDLEQMFETWPPAGVAANLGEFDCLIAADVLEHLRDPWLVLRHAAQLLRPGGTAVVSLPNVRYWHTFYALGFRGTWPRYGWGIFDWTHLHFFTLSDALGLLEQAELDTEHVSPQYRLRHSRHDLDVPRMLRNRITGPFFVYQYVLVARRR